MNWKVITIKHTGRCVECNEWINQGDKALWLEGTGIKHLECPTGYTEDTSDNSKLVIIDEQDKKMLGYEL